LCVSGGVSVFFFQILWLILVELSTQQLIMWKDLSCYVLIWMLNAAHSRTVCQSISELFTLCISNEFFVSYWYKTVIVCHQK